MGFFGYNSAKHKPCKCGAYSKAEHDKRLSSDAQVRGKGIKRSSPHTYTGPK